MRFIPTRTQQQRHQHQQSSYWQRVWSQLASLRAACSMTRTSSQTTTTSATDAKPLNETERIGGTTNSSKRGGVGRLDTSAVSVQAPRSHCDDTSIDRESDCESDCESDVDLDAKLASPRRAVLTWRETRSRLQLVAARVRVACTAASHQVAAAGSLGSAAATPLDSVAPSRSPSLSVSPAYSISPSPSPVNQCDCINTQQTQQIAVDVRASRITICMSSLSSRSLSDRGDDAPLCCDSDSDDDDELDTACRHSQYDPSLFVRGDALPGLHRSEHDPFERRSSSLDSYRSDCGIDSGDRSSALSDRVMMVIHRVSADTNCSSSSSDSDDDEDEPAYVRSSLHTLSDGSVVWIRSEWV